MSYPYLAKTTLKYKSPHATDLSFAKDETIRVTGPSEDDEDWLVGELLDGSKSGGFPKDFIVPIEGDASGAEVAEPAIASAPAATPAAAPVPDAVEPEAVPKAAKEPPVPPSAPAPPSPKPEPAQLPKATPAAAPAPAPAPAPAASGDPDDAPRQSMKERLAFFAAAQNKAAPPPPVKPKPAAGGLTWSQRQKLRQEQEEKEKAERAARGEEEPALAAPTPAAVSAAAPAAEPAPAVTTDDTADKSAGMSASDAASSIGQGGSLKERMAALRAGGAFGAPAEEKPAPPKPSGKTWTRPPAPPAPEPEEGEEDETDAERVKSPLNEEPPAEDVEGEEDDETEEEKEKARRAAIAARMAKLGARGPMGMAPAAPPKPARKPTREAITSPPADERSEPTMTSAEESADAAPAATEAPKPAAETDARSQPTSIPIAAIPRRTAPPRRRGPTQTATAVTDRDETANAEQRFEKVGPDGEISPPPQVMVADEEAPLPKTEEQLALEKEHEEAARGEQGAEGAAAAGIAMAPAEPDAPEDNADAPLVGALGTAASDSRGIGSISDRQGAEIKHVDSTPAQELEDGLEEGGAEKDDIMKQAAAGRLDVPSPDPEHQPPQPVEVVPIHPPASSGPPSDAGDDDAPPPPARHGMTDFPHDEVEMKHDHEAQDADEDDTPLPPPRPNRLSSDRPLGPRPLPSPGKERALPQPPMGNPLVPPRDDSEDERELESDGDVEEAAPPPPPPRQSTMPPVDTPAGDDDEYVAPPAKRESTILPPAVPSSRAAQDPILGDEEDAPPPPPRRQSLAPAAPADEDEDAPPPPPARKPSMPPPIQTASSDPVAAPSSPQITRSPSHMRSPSSQGPPSPLASTREELGSPTDEDEDKTRRSGIAARMAKLGGVKFGMPPPVPKKSQSTSEKVAAEEAPTSPAPREEEPRSPVTEDSPAPVERAAPAMPAPVQDDDESEEAQAARRRATLARLRAGGALGFGMFNHGPSAEPETDQRGLEAESEPSEDVPPPPARSAPPPAPASDVEDEAEDEAPPPPPARPPQPTPGLTNQDDDEAPPPPPAARPTRSSIEIPRSPASPVRSPWGRRPPIPAADRRLSSQMPPPSPSHQTRASESGGNWEISEEPAVMMMAQNETPPPPPPNRPQSGSFAQSPPVPPAHQRTSSVASRMSRSSRVSGDGQGFSPVTRQASSSVGHGQGQAPLSQQGHQEQPPSQEAAPRQSMAGGQRPGYDVLVNASKDSGARLARAARAMFDQGKKAYYGDGSPTGFVMIALDNAHVAPPQSGWGQLVYEQEAASVLKRYDEPRAGDIAAFHDAKLKGRKGLSSYDQHVGSVEEPLVGIVVDYEAKNKHKIKVLQVERGVPEEVSYRLDDLKTGRVAIYRPGL